MEQSVKKQKKISLWLLISLIIVSVALVIMTVLFAISYNKSMATKLSLESIYQKNFTELVDSVNNSEVKLSKVVASSYNSYSQKMLEEVSKNANDASNCLSSLPVSINGIDETIRFVNQVSGYTKTLSTNLAQGKTISSKDKETLQQLSATFKDLKQNLNKISKKIFDGNIYDQSIKLDGDYNNFTLNLQSVKPGDIEYPAMIYDGPFSDSQTNKTIKNIKGDNISAEQAKEKVKSIYKNVNEDSIEYLGQTNGKFKTFDFKANNDVDNAIYLQLSVTGGELLTISGEDQSNEENYTIDQAIQIAIDFANSVGVDNVECVWNDTVGGNAYINLAPKENDVILYPDLVKVKVDLSSGEVIGYEACSYFTNHVERNLSNSVMITKQDAEQKVSDGHSVISTTLSLAPLDYGIEKVCWEVKTSFEGSIYYYYINVETGEIENILKVIETDNGNLLM